MFGFFSSPERQKEISKFNEQQQAKKSEENTKKELSKDKETRSMEYLKELLRKGGDWIISDELPNSWREEFNDRWKLEKSSRAKKIYNKLKGQEETIYLSSSSDTKEQLDYMNSYLEEVYDMFGVSYSFQTLKDLIYEILYKPNMQRVDKMFKE